MSPAPPLLDLKEIRVLRALADGRTTTAAAERLAMSQSSLSRHLRAAEDRLGVALFQRGWSGTEPTTAGEIVVSLCQRLLADIERAERQDLGNPQGPPRLPGFLRWHHLQAVAAVVRHGSATAAATALGMRQPAISQALGALAGYVARPLFDRHPLGLTPTAAAWSLAALGERLAAELAALPALLAQPGPGLTGRVAVGMMPFSGQGLIMTAFGDLTRAHPRLRLVAVPGNYAALCEALRRREIDLIVGILRTPAPYADFVEEPLFRERYTLVARAQHPVHRAPVTIAALAGQTWIVAPHGTPIRRYFEALFHRHGTAPPAQSCEIWSFADAEQMICDSESLALLSYGSARLRKLRPGLRRVALELPDSGVSVGLTRLGAGAPEPPVQAFVAALKRRIAEAGD